MICDLMSQTSNYNFFFFYKVLVHVSYLKILNSWIQRMMLEDVHASKILTLPLNVVQIMKLTWLLNLLNEPAHNKTYHKTCATSETSISLCIHTVWSGSLLIACAFYSLEAIERLEPLPYWVDVQADLCWSHKSYCRFCCGLDQI